MNAPSSIVNLPKPITSPTQALIRRLRAEGLTQVQISRQSGIPQPRISRWYNGEVPAAVDDALKLQALVNQFDAAAKNRRASDKPARRR